MAILIIGGAGYIGCHTVAELLDQKKEIVVLDSLEKGHRNAILGGKFYCGNIDNEEFLERVFTENEIQSVIHFAAYSLVGESVVNPDKYYKNNVGCTLKLLEKMNEHAVKKIVFSSTAAVYGEPQKTPIEEGEDTMPTNPYGETKLTIEKMLKWFDSAYGIKYVSLRYFNAAGAHTSGRIGEDHHPETHLIPIIMQAALGKRDKLQVYGDDYDTPDGTCIRDYIHVTDLASAHILALKHLDEGGDSRVYNLGNGKGFSVKEVIDMAKRVTGRKIDYEVVSRRPGDPAVLVASSKRIMKELGWKPEYNGLEKIVETAWKWHSRI